MYEEICGYARQPNADEGALAVTFFANSGLVPETEEPNYHILATDYVSYSTVYSCTPILGFMR